ncbi:hypothetical protein Tco_0730081 [Tanacetum coccineum]|uniref:Uncharacterized protein n=1 Tax=Tanacetum coccineum TaxID=301880 RepID=A0ABQ4YT86_9ASTR
MRANTWTWHIERLDNRSKQGEIVGEVNVPEINQPHAYSVHASKKGRIDAIDADEEITLVSVHDVNVSASEEVFATTIDDITLAQVLEEMKSTKPKKKGVVIQELELVKPMNKKDLIRLDEETALNLQAEFDEE